VFQIRDTSRCQSIDFQQGQVIKEASKKACEEGDIETCRLLTIGGRCVTARVVALEGVTGEKDPSGFSLNETSLAIPGDFLQQI